MKSALVTGGAAGIGRETCRRLALEGCAVVLTARTLVQAQTAAAELLAHAPKSTFHAEALDVADPEAARACAERLADAGIAVDVLVNNAAILREGGVLDTPDDVWRATMETDFFGALWACRAFVPGMLERGYGRVVNVSSDYGSLGAGLDGPAAYSVAKYALNGLTIKLAAEVRGTGDLKVNAVHPGWVRTAMGGTNAERSVVKGADTVVWLATLPEDGPSGGFFHDREAFPW